MTHVLPISDLLVEKTTHDSFGTGIFAVSSKISGRQCGRLLLAAPLAVPLAVPAGGGGSAAEKRVSDGGSLFESYAMMIEAKTCGST